MREFHLLAQFDVVAPPRPPGAGNPLSHPIHGKDGGPLEGGTQKGARGMRQMVLAEKNSVPRNTKVRRDLPAHPQLVDHPSDHRLTKHFVRQRIGLESRHHDPVELSKWLFEECDIIELSPLNPTGLQTELDGRLRETEIVLDAGEAFFFRGSN